MKEETRGKIEKAIDKIRFELGNIEAIQEITPIQNEEEFLLGFALGYLSRYSELLVLTETMEKKKLTKTDEKEISKILLTRLPEIRKKIITYLNK